jgi:hypothetical protein
MRIVGSWALLRWTGTLVWKMGRRGLHPEYRLAFAAVLSFTFLGPVPPVRRHLGYSTLDQLPGNSGRGTEK